MVRCLFVPGDPALTQSGGREDPSESRHGSHAWRLSPGPAFGGATSASPRGGCKALRTFRRRVANGCVENLPVPLSWTSISSRLGMTCPRRGSLGPWRTQWPPQFIQVDLSLNQNPGLSLAMAGAVSALDDRGEALVYALLSKTDFPKSLRAWEIWWRPRGMEAEFCAADHLAVTQLI